MKKARVILINPPTADKSSEILLGLAYLTSALRKHGHEVKVIDGTAPYNIKSPHEIKKMVADFSPHFIGVSLTVTYIPQTYTFLNDLKKMKIPVVAGGSHVNPLSEEVLAHGTDIVALGEGENTVVELADYFCGNRGDLEGIKGLCFKKEDGTFFRTPPRPLIQNLDEIPFPAFEDFPIRYYTGSDDADSNPIFWAIFSSRGCPFHCTFCCGHNVFGRTYRLRSAKNICEEIKSLVDRFGVKKIAFQDDEVLLVKERIIELCDLLDLNKIKVKMSLRSRINSIDGQLLSRMKESGFRRIGFGIESWNDDSLRRIKKGYLTDDIKVGAQVLKKAGFPYMHFGTIIGFPWETKEHLRKSLMVIKKLPKDLRFFIVIGTPIPYPNTELYNEYHRKYGFTDWWLDPDKHWNGLPLNKPVPLFFYFARSMTPLYTLDLYWGYPKKFIREMEKFSWEVFRVFTRRHLKLGEFIFVYFLCRVSHAFWRKSPELEWFIFGKFPRAYITSIAKKISYTNME